jgi:hypothetical protein
MTRCTFLAIAVGMMMHTAAGAQAGGQSRGSDFSGQGSSFGGGGSFPIGSGSSFTGTPPPGFITYTSGARSVVPSRPGLPASAGFLGFGFPPPADAVDSRWPGFSYMADLAWRRPQPVKNTPPKK